MLIKSIFDRYKWFGSIQSHNLSRVKVVNNWFFPCLLVQIGSGISVLKLTETEYTRIDGSAVGGGVWCNLSKCVQNLSFEQLLQAGKDGNALNCFSRHAFFGR